MKLSVEHLSVTFETPTEGVAAVRDVSLTVDEKERVALVGESGCGKTVLLLALVGLLPRNARLQGHARFGDADLLDPGIASALRGREIAVCWSNAERYFNPVLRIGVQIDEACAIHRSQSRQQIRAHTLELLRCMGFSDPETIYRAYPFQLSGGMNQRAMIAMSLANAPKLLLVDEPTRGLDDRNRDKVVESLIGIRDTSMLIITHDLDLVHTLGHKVHFMRSGRFVDGGTCPAALEAPTHPYAVQLVRAGR